MKLSIGIVGLPNVGKSTLFKALTKNDILIANYPFATIDPNVGIVTVPDERLEKLAALSKSKKIIPAIIEFFDIAGLVKGANKGEGLGNQFLNHIRETHAVIMVVRGFKDESITHIENSVNPTRDIEIINSELILKDLETVEKRYTKAESEARSGEKEAKKLEATLRALKEKLGAGIRAAEAGLSPEALRELNLLTAKQQIIVLNGRESEISGADRETLKTYGNLVILDLGNPDPDLRFLIQEAYRILALISFFTTGETETRAWTISEGAKAPRAAGTIHTDFEKKFIRAEVIETEKLLNAGGWTIAKQKGWLRIEGKEYVIKDGDVLVVRHG